MLGLAARIWASGATITGFVAERLERAQTKALEASVRRALASLRAKNLVVQNERKLWLRSDDAAEEQARTKTRDRAETRRQKARDRRAADERELAKALAASTDVEKLTKLLGMLGSAHDGEVLAAARQIEVERKRLGRTWQQLMTRAASSW
jgi:hypothetical protein